MAAEGPNTLAIYMEALARKQKADPPSGYGYKADLGMGVGFFKEEKTGCQVLEKPVIIPSGQLNFQGNLIMYAYCSEEGVKSILEGQLPPMLPCTKKEPKDFDSLAAIADNFGATDPQAKSGNSAFCVPFRVPAELTSQAETPGRDLWIVRFDQDLVSPFLQAAKTGDKAKIVAGLEEGVASETVDEQGVSALMMAASVGSAETCEVLLTKSANVNYAEPTNKRTPLMFAAQGGFTDVVKVLVGAKADPLQVDSEGQTALMWAAVANKALTASALAPLGGKDLTNQQGLTAMAIAEKMGHADATAALKA